MFQGISVPLIAKICAAVVVTGGAGVATYEVADHLVEDSKAVVVDDAAAALAFSDDEWAGETDGKDPGEGRDEVVKKLPPRESVDAAASEEADEEPAKDAAEKAEEEPAEEAEKDTAPEPTEVDLDAPELVILWPKPDSHFTDRLVVFEGETEPGARVFAGPYEADVSDGGAWRIELVLSPGANRATLTAVDRAGNETDASVRVWLDVETEEPKEEKPEHDEEPESVSFSANQVYGTCGEELPYDVFWGTGAPNSVITVSSPFGGAEIEVDKHGHWEKKVYFEQAPRGDAFVVVVAGVGGSQSFEFEALPFESHGE